MEYVKVNTDFVLACEVGDIFEYPETGEYEKLRGERIVVLEKGKGCNPDHTYIRVLSFRPTEENGSFHFSCNDRYMDKVLEHWRFIGHMDISAVTNPEKFTDTWSGQAEYDARNNVKTADDVRYFVKRSMHNATSFNGMWTLHYISKLLTLVYESGMKYDVEYLFLDIVDYARSACYPEDLTRALKIISQMHFASKYISAGERFGQPSFQSIYEAAKLMNEAKAHITMAGRFTVKDLRDLTEVRTSAFAKPAEYVYGWDQHSLFDDTLIYEDPDESGVIRICLPAPRRLKTTVTKDDLAQGKAVSEAVEKCAMATKDEEIEALKAETARLNERIKDLLLEKHHNVCAEWERGDVVSYPIFDSNEIVVGVILQENAANTEGYDILRMWSNGTIGDTFVSKYWLKTNGKYLGHKDLNELEEVLGRRE